MNDLSSPGAIPGVSQADVAPPRERFKGPILKPRAVNPLGIFFWLFGILLPLFTLGFELVTHACATDFFDPIPTWWHVLLVALVPASNLLVWARLRPTARFKGKWLP